MKAKTSLFFFNQFQQLSKLLLLVLFWTITQTVFAQTYCDNSALPWEEYVKRVQLNTIDKSSGKCDGPCGYSDWTAEITDLTKGDTYDIFLTGGLNWANPNADLWWKVWIDYNQDGDFSDAGENVVTMNSNDPLQSSMITISNSATTGPTRMRIALRKSQYAPDCDGYDAGEVEDFTVNLMDGGTGNYCAVSATDQTDQHIKKVELNGYNSSNLIIDNASSYCDPVCGYTDFTNISATVIQGRGHGLSLTAEVLNGPPNINDEDIRWIVWVDLNQDGDFEDDGEDLLYMNCVIGEISGRLEIPNDALLGTTRMRIGLSRFGDPIACGTFGKGEVEDYTLNIEPYGGGSQCALIEASPNFVSFDETGGTATIDLYNPGNVEIDVFSIETIEDPPQAASYVTAVVNNSNTAVTLTISNNNGSNATARTAAVKLNCFDGFANIIAINVYQKAPNTSNSCWNDESAGYGLLATDIQYDPSNPDETLTFSRETPSPYTYSEMIGINQRSQAMNSVYFGGELIADDDAFITEFSSHVRSFHHHEKDYPQNEYPQGATPANAPPSEIGELYGGSIIKLYKQWKEIWWADNLDIEIIASLTNAVGVGTSGNHFPHKWFLEDQWGNNLSEVYANAKVYGEAFAATACPDPNGPCYVDMLEVGNEPWGFENPETFKQIYRGMVDGLKEYFVNQHNLPDDVAAWPMGVMPGAFQAFRAEKVIGTQNGGPLYDYIGNKLPCDYDEYIQGISLHPYGFVSENPNWQYDIEFTLDKEPENPRSIFQFFKNGIYWRNVNLPTKEPSNPDRYKSKIYISEFGYGSENYTPPCARTFPGVGELTQAMYNLRSILMMGRYGVYRASIYESWDHNDGGYYGYGLYREGQSGPSTPKPHYTALKNFKDQVGDTRHLRAIHDGDPVNGTNLYAYVLGDMDEKPTHLVVWNGAYMEYAVAPNDINMQRTNLTSNGGPNTVSIDLSMLTNITVDDSQVKWLHDLPSQDNYPSSAISVTSGNVITMNVSPIPVLIPLDGGVISTPDLTLDISSPANVSAGVPFNVTLTVTNGSTQTASNIQVDGSTLNFNNSSNNAAAFVLLNETVSDGNFNTWTGEWDQFSLVPGESATAVLEFRTRIESECVQNIPLSANGTSGTLTFSDSHLIDCGDSIDPCQNDIQDPGEEGVDCGGNCPTTCPPNDFEISVVANPNIINAETVFDVTVTLVNNTSQTVTSIEMDGTGLNYNNASNNSAAFNLANYNITTSHGNYNYWTALWDGFSLAMGETATLTMQLKIRAVTECQQDIPLIVSCTSSEPSVFDNTDVDCDINNPLNGGANINSSILESESLFDIVRLYPNPVSDEINVVITSKRPLDLKAQIFNIHGELLQERTVSIEEGINQSLFEIEQLPAGMYYLSFDGFIGKKKSLKFTKIKL